MLLVAMPGAASAGPAPDDPPGEKPIYNGGFSSDVAVRLTLAGSLVVSLEYGCPPPGLLACRSGVRVRVRTGSFPGTGAIRNFGDVVYGALGRAGDTPLRSRVSRDGKGGWATSGGVTVLRWQWRDGVLEAVGGKLELRPGMKLPPHPDSRAERSPFQIEFDPVTFDALIRNATYS